MARTFVYRYVGQEEPVVKLDPDEKITIPERGEIIVRNGKTWRVDSVKFVETFGPERESPSRLEVRVSLASLRSPQACI